jgi:hypothetical protein
MGSDCRVYLGAEINISLGGMMTNIVRMNNPFSLCLALNLLPIFNLRVSTDERQQSAFSCPFGMTTIM